MELTGVTLEGKPDIYGESQASRLEKLCRIAEQHTPIQIGFTLVRLDEATERFTCTSYNFFVFPWVGPELLGARPAFLCNASALRFNAGNDVDFNAWIKEGVPFMSREDEVAYLQSLGTEEDAELPQKVGMLRLWKALCAAGKPLVVHCPLDLFFLLACFERRHLPSHSAQEIAALVFNCFPKDVFDTAYLHGLIGGFSSRALTSFLRDAQARHELDVENGAATPCAFELEAMTEARHGGGGLAHEAGFDSLLTARLFAYLVAISPAVLSQGVNRLFLFKSAECLDLNEAVASGKPWVTATAHKEGATLQGITKCTAKEWLDGPGDEQYFGVVKSFNARRGFGFIECRESFAKYGLDVWVHERQLGSYQVGQAVTFTISTNRLGKPQARTLALAGLAAGLTDEGGSSTRSPLRSAGSTTEESLDGCGAESDKDNMKLGGCS
jgi:cold shock CspA family protein